MNKKIILDRAALAKIIESLKDQGKKIVLTNGGFNILHVGHVRSLIDAKSRGDILLVALNGDNSLKALKGENYPIIPEDERLQIIAALECVDFVTTFKIPELGAGLYEIEIDDGEDVQIAKFSIISPTKPPSPPPPPEPAQLPAVIEINRLAGNVGAEVVASGTGFLESGVITIQYDGELLASADIDAEGEFLLSFRVPVGEHGDHIMIISDGLNTKELTFTVESEAPAAPELLLGTPIVVKEGDELLLDWEDVVDKSMPVSYALQLAQDERFSAGSVFLDKAGLADSEYLIEASTMKLLRPRRSYYWRVRAVDSASNIGEWTRAAEIKIAPVSTMPAWLMYTLAVLGALFILFIWYMIRRADRKTG